jgi:hypothetical protein
MGFPSYSFIGGLMKTSLIYLLLLSFLLTSAKGYCEIDGPIAREALKREALSLLYSSQFKKLEKQANHFLVKKERFPDGSWKLYSFFDAFQSPLCKSDTSWKRHLRFLEDWQTAFPASNAANTALAGGWAGYAWFARGTGYEINDGGYQLMVDRLGRAKKILGKASNSYVPALNIQLQLALANSATSNEYETLLKKALSSEPAYTAFYAAAINYYSPRWHGKPGEWVEKLEQFNKTAPRNEGIYARVAFGFLGREWNNFSERTMKWEIMKKSLKDISFDSPWIDNMAASYACLAKDYDMARGLLNKIGPNIYYPAWQHVNLWDCKKKAGLSDDFNGYDTSVDYKYMNELSKNNNPWATELIQKWTKLKMVGFTYKTDGEKP